MKPNIFIVHTAKKRMHFPFFSRYDSDPDQKWKGQIQSQREKKAKIVSLGAQQLVTGAVHLKGHLYILFTPKRFIEL